jgi:hypothetical protein
MGLSKAEVVQILKALGGRGTRKQIHTKARELFPNYPAIPQYTEIGLTRLRRWGDVKWEHGVWILVAEE